MKTIEEKALELSDEYYNNESTIKSDIEIACIKMAEFTQRWILVEEKPSEIDIFMCKTHSEIEDDILYFMAIYDPKTDRWYSEFNKLFKEHECNVTHYKPIELK